MYLGAAILECSYRALQRVAAVQNWGLTPQLHGGFQPLLPAPREPLAAHGARPVLREASAVPLPAERDLPSSRRKPFGPGFSSLWDAVPRFFSTSCSRRNPKSITLSKKCW